MHRKVVCLAGALAFAVPVVAEAASFSVVERFDPLAGELPESITTGELGNVYLSIGNTVRRVDPWGHESVLATIPIPAGAFVTGLKIGPDGHLYAGSGGFAPDPSAAFVWRISLWNGAVEQFAALDPLGFPNDLAFDDEGDLYVTDPFLGLIWKIDGDGNADVWLADPLLEGNPADPAIPLHDFGVDGIAFNRHKDDLYVGNLDYGRIVRIGVECDGEPGDVEVWFEDHDLLAGADGIAFDWDEKLYVAVNPQDRIVTIDQDKHAAIFHQGAPLDGPSSLAFGEALWNFKTLYVSNFAVSRAFGLQPGTPDPALLKTGVKRGGLNLP